MFINTLLVVCCIVFVVQSVDGMECNSISNCGCELEDGSARVDLTPMTKLMSIPMFTQDSSSAKYFVDMCRDFDCNVPSQVCAEVSVLGKKTNVSLGKDLTFEYDEAQKHVTFVYTSGQHATHISLVCANADMIGSLTTIELKDGGNTVLATLKSKYACWKYPDNGDVTKKGLSDGSIMCIVLLVLIVVYVVGGILTNKYVRKVQEHDGDLFPNKKMWTGLPSLIKDGCMFTCTKLRGRNNEYQPI